MLRDSPLRFIFPIGMFIAFFLDGAITSNLAGILFRSYSMVPYFTVLWLVLSLFFEGNINLHLEIWSAIVGFLFDLFYFRYLGICLFIFPLIIYISKWLYRYLNLNFISAFLIYFIDITVMLVLSFMDYRIFDITDFSYTNFLVNMLGPTLALNLFIFAILYFPIQFLFNRYRVRQKN
ncbi:rod shape-determining protein MreD [Philodulcilactobacillus myokoensis]|uniref:Rod shape-determining protein MreD n=1 Tax=Philodulcilactobacillus myokoensis TaxID=2929573 RepID=A0A9W6B202_9LACO|nr:rod shape-determining protein MreD [Philodulcilactobacillus myokoensis]GLB46664.1 rod shape-determining protein MreD [Philodulcilactobacillus myokoensis]